ncbi:DNA polymerase I [Arthrobacter phage Racecar]|nr:DNA polymerase I [Arthrobacter phage Racecar]QFG12855.1 DNA polymerase I [Arthrobacter phage Mimi]
MPRLPSDIDLRLVSCIDDLFALKSWLGERREVMGLDTETSGLDPYASDARLRLIQIGDHKTGWSIPWEGWGGAAIECLNAWDGPLTLHNASFDAKWLKRHANWEMPWHRTHDTMIMAQIERPGGRNDLKHLSTTFIDPMADAGQKELKDAMKAHGWSWGTIPTDYEAYWVYSSLDPVLAAHLWSHFRTDLRYPEAYDLEMAVRRICTNMEDTGMRVDLEYSKEKFDELTQQVHDSKAWAKENWGISIGSNVQLADFFANTLKAEFEVFSKTSGKPSVDKVQLGLFEKSEDPMVSAVAKFVLEVRHKDKMSNSYFKNFLNMHNESILHPSIKTMGARTGRMSVTDPALQTLPRGDSLIRGAFIPRREGDILISCDYSQVEMRLLAHFSGDPDLQGAFKEADATGGDFFVSVGRQVYNEPDFSKKDPRRSLMKGVMYGAAYGSGIQTMADAAGVSFAQMQAVAEDLFTKFPGIKDFMKRTEQMGELREKEEGVGYIVTGTGRRLPADKGKMYTLTNYMLQGTAAELMKKAIVRLDAAGYGPYMQIAIHDEMIFSLPEHMVEKALPEIEELMSYCNGEFGVDLPAEPEIIGAKSWGEKYAA